MPAALSVHLALSIQLMVPEHALRRPAPLQRS
jgi:hypothetical protein